jgi:N-acetylneuraminate synthase
LTKGIRILEQSLGKNKKIYRKEKQIEKWAKRSLVSIKDIRKGDKLSEENLWSKRPGTGIPSRLFFKYLNRTAKKNIKKNTLIKKNQILL